MLQVNVSGSDNDILLWGVVGFKYMSSHRVSFGLPLSPDFNAAEKDGSG